MKYWRYFLVGIFFFFPGVLKESALFVRAQRKILNRNCCLSYWNLSFPSVSAVTFPSIRWQPLHRIVGWFADGFVVWDYHWNILCLIKDFLSSQIWGEAKYRCSIPNSKHEQAVWDSISSVIANCKCVYAMERRLKVFLHTWRGQCIVEKELNYIYLICFPQPLATLLLCALVGSFGVLPDEFFPLGAAPWHLFLFQTVNRDVV